MSWQFFWAGLQSANKRYSGTNLELMMLGNSSGLKVLMENSAMESMCTYQNKKAM